MLLTIKYYLCQDVSAVTDNTTTTAISAVMASYKCKASAIVVLTTSGATSHIVSKYKPHCPILSVTRYVECGLLSPGVH